MNGPTLGVFYHWLGGLAAASFYIPYKGVRQWSWETYWLVGGFFSWIVAPWIMASLLVPNLLQTLLHAPRGAMMWAAFFGILWGVGGLTFGLSVRYLGVALGYAVALGCCAVFGTLIPPIFDGSIRQVAGNTSGRFELLGVAICVVGIIVSSLAGVSKGRDMPAKELSDDVPEFNLFKGLAVAIFAGVLSACMSFAFKAGKPIALLTGQSLASHGGSDLWQNLPVLIVVLMGGFCTNFVWCIYLNLKNRSASEYLGIHQPQPTENPTTGTIPLLGNYTLSALAGVTWYMQFFFYSMGQTKMGKFDFSSWTLHMASIILFSTLWGIALKEWNGTSPRTKSLVGLGIFVLVLSTTVIGYGNYIGTQPQR